MMTTDKLLNKYFIIRGQSTINPSTGLVDVNGSAVLISKINELPVKFGKITRDFTCNNSQLQSLAGAPQSVGGNFYCGYNSLQSLAGAPQAVGGHFTCNDNQFQSLEGAPQYVGRHFYCNNNPLQSLAGAPQSVGGDFYCNYNSLKSLAGAPQSVGGGFRCNGNQLQSLAGAPQSVGGDFYCNNNPLQSLDGLPKIIRGNIVLTYSRDLLLLKLFMVKELKRIGFMQEGITQLTPGTQEVESILNQYLPLGIKGMLPCAAELLKAGYRNNARL